MLTAHKDARRHVNKMCLAAQIPLVESGTAGYLGQVQPMVKVGDLAYSGIEDDITSKDAAECFDCVPKPTPKTFPVCTIRSTPSQPIHCIVWAKSYLCRCVFHHLHTDRPITYHRSQLFGEDENAVGELDEAEKQGENGVLLRTTGILRLTHDQAQEIAALRKEALAFQAVRSALRSKDATDKYAARMAFQKVIYSPSGCMTVLNHLEGIPL